MAADCVAWINGRFVPLREASLSVLDAGVTGGVTVTERLRTFRHEPFLLDDHLDRLAASAEAANVPLPTGAAELGEVVREVVRRNAALIPSDHDLSVSAFVTGGVDGVPTACVHATPIPAGAFASAYDAGIALACPPTRSIPSETLSPHIKTRSRLHWHVADREAVVIDPEAKALLLHADGTLAETATGNVFVVRGRELLTPPRERTLRGISQRYVFGSADGLGVPCREVDLRPEDAATAAEVFVTSSVYCLLPVVRLDGAAIGDGRPGPIYRRLLRAWSEAVGVDIAGQMRRMADAAGGA